MALALVQGQGGGGALVWLPRETPLNAAAEAFKECLLIQARRLGVEVLPVVD